MSANDIDDLDPAVVPYVDAFRRVERPSEATAARSWEAIAAATAAPHAAPQVVAWRRPWVIASGVLAAAAAVALLVGRFSVEADDSGVSRGSEAPFVAPKQPSASPTPGATPRAPDPVAELPVVVPTSVPPVVTPSVSADPPLVRPRADRREREPAVGPEPTDDDSLAQENRLWIRAQSELADGKPEASLATIATWKDRFSQSEFASERTLIEARALCRAGRREQAQKLRDAFAKRSPDSPLAARMREVCVDGEGSP